MSVVSVSEDSYSYIEKPLDEELLTSCLSERIGEIEKYARIVWDQMGIKSARPLKIKCYADRMSLNSSVCISNDGFTIKIPILHLLDRSDFEKRTVLHKAFSNVLSSIFVSDEQMKTLDVFFELIKDQEMHQKAKTFVLYHEIAHILHGDLLSDPVDNQDSCEREKRADLTAAKYSGCADGQIYYLKIKNGIYPKVQVTHPSYEARIKYLSEYLVDPKA